jgi:sarcosine oxidase delta subunit
MVEITCPWCEQELSVEFEAESAGQTCPHCLTSWTFEESAELALAA